MLRFTVPPNSPKTRLPLVQGFLLLLPPLLLPLLNDSSASEITSKGSPLTPPPTDSAYHPVKELFGEGGGDGDGDGGRLNDDTETCADGRLCRTTTTFARSCVEYSGPKCFPPCDLLVCDQTIATNVECKIYFCTPGPAPPPPPPPAPSTGGGGLSPWLLTLVCALAFLVLLTVVFGLLSRFGARSCIDRPAFLREESSDGSRILPAEDDRELATPSPPPPPAPPAATTSARAWLDRIRLVFSREAFLDEEAAPPSLARQDQERLEEEEESAEVDRHNNELLDNESRGFHSIGFI